MTGRIDISQLNIPPDKSEFAVAKYFAELGKDIVFIPPSAIPGQHRPDILMDGVEWEIIYSNSSISIPSKGTGYFKLNNNNKYFSSYIGCFDIARNFSLY